MKNSSAILKIMFQLCKMKKVRLIVGAYSVVWQCRGEQSMRASTKCLHAKDAQTFMSGSAVVNGTPCSKWSPAAAEISATRCKKTGDCIRVASNNARGLKIVGVWGEGGGGDAQLVVRLCGGLLGKSRETQPGFRQLAVLRQSPFASSLRMTVYVECIL